MYNFDSHQLWCFRLPGWYRPFWSLSDQRLHLVTLSKGCLVNNTKFSSPQLFPKLYLLRQNFPLVRRSNLVLWIRWPRKREKNAGLLRWAQYHSNIYSHICKLYQQQKLLHLATGASEENGDKRNWFFFKGRLSQGHHPSQAMTKKKEFIQF